MKRCYFFKFWFPVICYSGIIFYVSSLSRVSVPLSGINFDKLVHVIEYMPFGFLLARALWQKKQEKNFFTLCCFVLMFSCLYGLSDEWHQSFVPGRHADILDVVADSVGGCLGSIFYCIYVKRFLLRT